jgi:hypothetical protein
MKIPKRIVKTLVFRYDKLGFDSIPNLTNKSSYLDQFMQTLYQITQGTMSSTHNGIQTLVDDFSYPFTMDFTYTNPNWTTCKCCS